MNRAIHQRFINNSNLELYDIITDMVDSFFEEQDRLRLFSSLTTEFLVRVEQLVPDLIARVDRKTAEERRLVLFSLFLHRKVTGGELKPEQANRFLTSYIVQKRNQQAGAYAYGVDYPDYTDPTKTIQEKPVENYAERRNLTEIANKHKAAIMKHQFSLNIGFDLYQPKVALQIPSLGLKGR